MFVASLPLPSRHPDGAPRGTEGWPIAVLDDPDVPRGAELIDPDPDVPPPGPLFSSKRIGSARLQLAYPWIETDDSRLLPEGVQEPKALGACCTPAPAQERPERGRIR